MVTYWHSYYALYATSFHKCVVHLMTSKKKCTHSIQKNSTPDIYILNTATYRNWLPCRTNTLQTLWSRFIFYLFYCYKIRLHRRKVRCPVELYLEFLITIYNAQWVRSLRMPSSPFPFFIRLDIIVSRRTAYWTPVFKIQPSTPYSL